MRFGQDVLSDASAALAREWILGNGLRGSASGTVANVPSRASQALLTAVGQDGQLVSLLRRLDERLIINGASFALGSNPTREHSAIVLGELESFALDPWPVWRYHANGVRIEKSMFLIYGHNAVAITYRHLEGPEATITSCPLLVMQPPGELQHQVVEASGAADAVPGRVRIDVQPERRLTLWHDGGFMPTRTWQRVQYEGADAAREEALVVGYVERRLANVAELHLIVSAEDDLFRVLAQEDRLGSPPPRTLAGCVAAIEAEERRRVRAWRSAAVEGARATAQQAADARKPATTENEASSADADLATQEAVLADSCARPFDANDPWIPMLAESLRTSLVRHGRRLTLVASYPHAEERAVDVLRALPGMIALRGFNSAREILRGYLEYADDGLVPERFGPDGRPGLGSPESAMWLVMVTELYGRRSGDNDFIRETAYPVVAGIMHFLRSGTRTGVHVNEEGLLVSIDGGVKIVRSDLNILWSHALVAMSQLARTAGKREHAAFHLAWAREHQNRFNEVMWDEEHGCLYRALGPVAPRSGLDPSQLLAVSLPPASIPHERALAMLKTMKHELFTPFGIRDGKTTASTAWLGAFFSAYLRAHGRSAEAQSNIRGWLKTLHAQLASTTLGHLPERFIVLPRRRKAAAAAPHDTARVSPVAAAELLRFWVEDLEHAGASAEIGYER